MTLLKGSDQNSREINVALLSLEADIKKLSKNTNFNTDDFDAQLADINKRIDEINGVDETVVKNLKNDVIAINSDIDNIENDISTINTNIDNIEQQLSNIFTAENKVTDFNTTTNSGIYYWTDDAANKPGTDYGVLLVNKFDNGSGSIWINQIAYGTNNKIYFRQNINSGNWTGWKTIAFDGEVTAKKVANALTINGKTYDGSSAVNAGVQTVANGGTGVTTQAEINKAFIGNLDVGTSDVTDGTEFVSSYASDSGFSSTDEGSLHTPYKRKFIKVWNYIKGKISSVLGLTGSKLTLQGGTVSSNSFTDANPKIVFNNADASQGISLTFTDFDAVQAPASLTLNGNQGNEYFIAPCIKASRNITLDSSSGATLSSYGSEPLSIGFPSGTYDGQSLGIDRNSMQVRINGAASDMYLNYNGGMVTVNYQNQSNGGLKVKQKMVIPIGAPSQLEDGCIWIS